MNDEQGVSAGDDCPETMLRQDTPAVEATSDWTPPESKPPKTPKSLGRLQLIAPAVK
jgi:hypothetical protein